MQISTPWGGGGVNKLFHHPKTWGEGGWLATLCWNRGYSTSFQITDLRSFGCSSIDTGRLQARSSAILSSHLLHLLCQLTGRREDETLQCKRNFCIKTLWHCVLPFRVQHFQWLLEMCIVKKKCPVTTYNWTISTFEERLVVNVDNCWQQILGRGEKKTFMSKRWLWCEWVGIKKKTIQHRCWIGE